MAARRMKMRGQHVQNLAHWPKTSSARKLIGGRAHRNRRGEPWHGIAPPRS
eukprot:CAMPEP_0117607450 /NCGR_PEP_ID=MMETSP0784-20121206/80259_1 /TAXON_ID=39447 /ORGANISM="" /LENGTH=50 /DNA_ID=CAMNT_0005410613 /DNA_START=59 /DNA_END=208 /DNA_ORIENTATION=-